MKYTCYKAHSYNTTEIPGGLVKALNIIVTFFIILPCFVSGQFNSAEHSLEQKANLFKNRVEYDSAVANYIRLQELFSNSAKQKEQLMTGMEISDVYILQRKFNQADSSLQEISRVIYRQYADDAELIAKLYEIKGSYFQSNGSSDSARSYLFQAIELRSSLPGSTDTSLHYAYNKLGNLYLSKPDFDSAYLFHKIALDLSLKKMNEVNFLSASSYQNLGISVHMKGDFNKAEEYYAKSLHFKEQLFGKLDPALAKIYWNLGKFYTDLAKYDSALHYYDKSEQLLITKYSRDDIQFAHVYWNKGNVYTLEGDYIKSENYLLQAFSILEKNYGINNQTVSKVLMDLGFAYQKLGDTVQAITYYLQAAKNKENSGIIKIYRNLGNIYSSLNEADSAEKYYHLAISNAREYFTGQSYDLALCYQYFGEFLADKDDDDNNDDDDGDNEQALKYYSEAARIFYELFGPKNKDLAKAYLLESQLFFNKGEFNAALDKNQQALVTLLPNFNQSDPDSNPAIEEIITDLYLPNILSFKSKILFYRYKKDNKINDLTLSLETIKLTLAVIEEIRKTYNKDESQIILNKEARINIDLGVKVSYELYSLNGDKKYLKDAFQFTEKGQSIILLSALRGLQAQETINIPKNTLDYENYLSRELSTYNDLLYQEKQKKEPDESKLKFWSDKIFNLNIRLDSLLLSYQLNYPEFFRLRYDYSVISLDSLQGWLPPDQAIVQYHITDTLLFGFVITDNIIELKTCGLQNNLLAILDSLNHHFKHQDFFNAGQDQFRSLIAASTSLYDTLVRPFSDIINGKRLVIIPDGELGYLSFDLLLSDSIPGDESSYAQLPWLIRKHAISYSSSATVFYEQSKSKPGRKSNGVLAFAPAYDYYLKHRDAGNVDSMLFNLGPITGTREEINSIGKLFKTSKRFDEKASEDYFKSHAGKYGILHLAMHTIIDNQNPLYSKLVFSHPETGSKEDGYLNTHELFRLHLPGQLAVLSACNTGTGKLERGEGIISLARGFFYAGIPSVLMTLWEIEDHSSASLMALFYENLKKGYPNDIALQMAKLNYIENAGKLQSHPYFWAGYVNIGKTDTIDLNTLDTPIHLIMIALTAIACIIAGYLFINNRVFLRKK